MPKLYTSCKFLEKEVELILYYRVENNMNEKLRKAIRSLPFVLLGIVFIGGLLNSAGFGYITARGALWIDIDIDLDPTMHNFFVHSYKTTLLLCFGGVRHAASIIISVSDLTFIFS